MKNSCILGMLKAVMENSIRINYTTDKSACLIATILRHKRLFGLALCAASAQDLLENAVEDGGLSLISNKL